MRAAGCVLAAVAWWVGSAAASGLAVDLPPATRFALAEAVQLALAHSPSLGVLRALSEAAESALAEARAARLPTADLATTVVRYEKPMVVTPIHGLTPGQAPEFDRTLLQTALALGYTLVDGGATSSRVAQGAARTEVARTAIHAAEQATLAATVSVYLRVLTLRQTLDAHRQRLGALGSERERVQRFLDQGRAAQVDLLRIKAAEAAAAADEIRLRSNVATAEGDLARLVGKAPEELRACSLGSVAPVDQMPFDPAPSLRGGLAERARARSPAVAQAQRELGVAEAAVHLARSANRPRINLVGRHLGFGGGSADLTFEWNVGVQVGIPVYTGGAVGHRVAAAEAQRVVASESLRRVILDLEGQLDRALAALAEARARLASLGTAVDSLAELARIERLRLEEGVGTQIDYLSAEADLVTSRAGLVEALGVQVGAWVELARLTGELDQAWLERYLEGVW